MKNVPHGTLKPITALISWEEKFRGMLNWGTILILMGNGTVWEMATFRDREGGQGFREAKKRQTLIGLKKEFGKDLEGMALTWRAMNKNRNPSYEMMGPVHLEKIKIKFKNT